MKAKEFLVLN